jgi:hypothetical protein
MALLRTDVLARLVEAAEAIPTSTSALASERRALVTEVTTVKAGPMNALVTSVEVYYTSIQILIETLGRVKLTSPAIAELLSDADKRRL